MSFARTGTERGIVLPGPLLMAPALLVVAVCLVGFGAGGIARIDSLEQVASGPAGGAQSQAIARNDGTLHPDAQAEALAPESRSDARSRGGGGDGSGGGSGRGDDGSGGGSQSAGGQGVASAGSPSPSAPASPGADPSGGQAYSPDAGGGATGGGTTGGGTGGGGGVLDGVRGGVKDLTDPLPRPSNPIKGDVLDAILDGPKLKPLGGGG